MSAEKLPRWSEERVAICHDLMNQNGWCSVRDGLLCPKCWRKAWWIRQWRRFCRFLFAPIEEVDRG